MWAVACIMGELIDGQPLFPGENEIDQLYLIQKMLGELLPEQKELFLRNPRFVGVKFPDIGRPETIERRYLGKISKRALSFMKSLLKLDPSQRLTSKEALQHPYFEGLNDDWIAKNKAGGETDDAGKINGNIMGTEGRRSVIPGNGPPAISQRTSLPPY